MKTIIDEVLLLIGTEIQELFLQMSKYLSIVKMRGGLPMGVVCDLEGKYS